MLDHRHACRNDNRTTAFILPPDPAFADTAEALLRPGAPLLLVRDLERVTRYHEQVIRLGVLRKDRDEAHLGAGTPRLLTLRRRQGIYLELWRFAGLFIPNRMSHPRRDRRPHLEA